MISVALIEDNRLVREGLAAMLERTEDFSVVAVASGAEPARLKEANPEVILLDVGLWDDDSLRLAQTLKEEYPQSRVIIMDLLPVHEDIIEFVNAGVSGFILKDATFDDLVSTIRSVVDGAHVLPPEMTSSLFSQIAREAVGRTGARALEAVRLTPREREVIDLISEGLSNKEIAARLGVASHTVKSHVRNVMEKLALHTRLQIAAFANKSAAS
ncbi:MAG TPA: response regulator transcription factor [Longimicrobiaceae bacterium]|jgi:DNA-binding NarL/FixJ family response regulator|nr:response regulator transcription factor [Longimicrobiaceae bacterium]